MSNVEIIEVLSHLKNSNDLNDSQKAIDKMNKFFSEEKNSSYLGYVQESIPQILKLSGNKSNSQLRESAKTCVETLSKGFTTYSSNPMINICMDSLTNKSSRWQEKVLAMEVLGSLAKIASQQVEILMPKLIPIISSLMWSAKKQERKAATATMQILCSAIDNRDLKPFIPILISCINHPEEVEECVYQLSATRFVQTVNAAALSITVPLLHRGFNQGKTATKRKCAVITENMAKLVENPEHVVPFMSTLAPALERASNTVADPECRQRCEKAYQCLNQIYKKNTEVKKEINLEEFKQILSLKVNNNSNLNFLTNIASSLTQTCNLNINLWNQELSCFLGSSITGESSWQDTVQELNSLASKYCTKETIVDQQVDQAETLCDCTFSLAYGSRILLNNARLNLQRGYRYGVVAQKSAGKTTLLKAIANGQLDNFPPPEELKTVFVDTDVQGFSSKEQVDEYCLRTVGEDGIDLTKVTEMLLSVGFTAEMIIMPITSLSGGWRMKLALARAMLRNADILLMDEPTNHLDVLNVQWVVDYLTGDHCKEVTSIIVSHDTGFLDKVSTHIIHLSNMKLTNHKGNMSNFVELNPEAKSYYDLTATKLVFKFPDPGQLSGVTAKGKGILSLKQVSFKYPNTDKMILNNVSVSCSMASRVACVGANGAGKSTMIKLLTGELEPTTGKWFKHPNCRFAYVAQHAFHHIEQHLDKTPNQYIQWRYQGGEDKEDLIKSTAKISPEEKVLMKKPIEVIYEDEEGKSYKEKRVVEKLIGRRKKGRTLTYEVKWIGKSQDLNTWFDREKLIELGFEKLIAQLDRRIVANEGLSRRTLTQRAVEEHLENVGLDKELGTHNRIRSLSGGQKVKVVLGACTWSQPHLIILDEPTNYLDREALGALANAIKDFGGGVLLITHNKEFAEATTRATWVVADGKCDIKGDAEWEKYAEEQIELKIQEEQFDAAGNKIEKKKKPSDLTRKEKKKITKELKKKIKYDAELTPFEEDCAMEWDLF